MNTLADAIPNKVRAMRLARGWSLAKLAEEAGTTAPTIMKLEKSQRRLDLDWIERLAAAFGVSAAELAFGGGGPMTVRHVPIVGTIPAGNWREAVQHAEGEIPVPAGMDGGASTFALRPIGDSMDLLIPTGGYVLVDPEDGELRDGRVYAVMNGDGETTVKRYRAEPARLEPCSSNPSHKEMLLGSEPITVIGRVIGSFAKM